MQLNKSRLSVITGNIRAIADMAQRLRNGVFDPEADKRDFEEYLRYGIGRTAQDAESEVERMRFGRTIITMNKAWCGITDATIKLRESLQNGQ